jgi:hypothetical protein
MKKIIIYLLVCASNIGLYFILSLADVFAEYILFGEGEGSAKYSIWVSLFFVVLQVSMLFFLYKKKIIIKDRILLVCNIILVVCLYLFFSVYLPAVTTY